MSQHTKLYVGSLPYSLSEEDLKELFGSFGVVISATIIIDKMTGKSKGFGFVEMETEEAANKAIDAVHGSDVSGRTLIVNIARPEPKKSGFGPRTGGGDRRRDGAWPRKHS